MRFVIYGAGGIGGTIGARSHQAGFDVCLIARGEHFRAIQRDGLRFVSPTQDVVLDIPCADHPRTAQITPDDAVILCMKGQHTEARCATCTPPPGVQRTSSAARTVLRTSAWRCVDSRTPTVWWCGSRRNTSSLVLS